MNVDWPLLRKQKTWILNKVDFANREETEMVDGLVALIDHIQDYAVGNGNATEEEVFGKEEQ